MKIKAILGTVFFLALITAAGSLECTGVGAAAVTFTSLSVMILITAANKNAPWSGNSDEG